MHLRLLFWSLRYRKWRHALNVLTIAVTVAVLMMFISVLTELVAFSQVKSASGLSRIIMTPTIQQPDSRGLPATFGALLRDIPGVKDVQCYKAFSGRHESGARYHIVGEQESGVEYNTDFFPVEKDVIEAWKKEKPQGAIVAEASATELGLRVGQTVELPTPHGPLSLKVVGFSKGGLSGHRIAAHIGYIQAFTKEEGLCWYRVYSTHADYDSVVREIVERTKTTVSPMTAFSDRTLTADLVKQVAFIPALLGFLGLFLLFTTVLTLANGAAISIRERRIETATMRVLGYKPRTIVWLLLSEGILIGVIGGLLAIAATAILFKDGVQLTPGGFRLLQAVTLSKLAMGIGLVVAALIPTIGVLFPALVSVRTPLVTALRDNA